MVLEEEKRFTYSLFIGESKIDIIKSRKSSNIKEEDEEYELLFDSFSR